MMSFESFRTLWSLKGAILARRNSAIAAAAEPINELWPLPDGWEWRRLFEVSDIPQRGEPRTNFSDKFSYLDVSGIDGKNLSPRIVSVTDAPSRARQFLRPNDTVISGVRVYLRNFALIEAGGPDVASTAFCVLRPKKEIHPQYLFYWVGSDQFIQRLLPLQRGNSPPAVLDTDIREQPIPVPSLAMQRQIMARVGKLFAEIEDGETALAEARTGLDAYGSSLLNAVITGRLTKDWRESHKSIGTGIDLLQALNKECLKRASSKRFQQPQSPNFDYLPPLPAGWIWASLGQLAWSAQYGTSQKCSPSGHGEAVLRIPNLRNGAVNLSDLKKASTPLNLEDADYVHPGDLLIVRTNGSEDLIGRTGIVIEPFQEPTHFASYLIRFRLLGSETLWHWIRLFTGSGIFRTFVLDSIGSSAGQYNLNLEKLFGFPIAIPPASEMDAAIDIYNRLLDAVPEVSANVEELRQSVLNAAFRGDLIS